MRSVITKSAKLLLALMIPSMFLFSCNEDSVEPSSNTKPDPKTITVPK